MHKINTAVEVTPIGCEETENLPTSCKCMSSWKLSESNFIRSLWPLTQLFCTFRISWDTIEDVYSVKVGTMTWECLLMKEKIRNDLSDHKSKAMAPLFTKPVLMQGRMHFLTWWGVHNTLIGRLGSYEQHRPSLRGLSAEVCAQDEWTMKSASLPWLYFLCASIPLNFPTSAYCCWMYSCTHLYSPPFPLSSFVPFIVLFLFFLYTHTWCYILNLGTTNETECVMFIFLKMT